MEKKSFSKVTIPTYEVGKAETLPLFFEKRPYQGASGKIYPIPFTSKIGNDKVDKEYKAGILENKYIKVVVLPEIGGKIQSAIDKTTGYDFVYNNKVIKPAMVGLAGPWVSGGIEFNWPQHHRPTTFMEVEASIQEENGETIVWVGETEPFNRMKGMVGFSVEENKSYIKAKVKLFNRTPYTLPFMWWANLAVEVSKGYKIVFPPDVEYVNDHDRRAVLKWPKAEGVYKTARPFNYGKGTDIHEFSSVKVPSSFMVSRGQSEGDFVSGYDTNIGCGIVTVADHHVSSGKKLWTWGGGKFGKKWCSNLTDDGSQYVELMTGVYTDNQPDFTYIMPYETKEFEQYWYPISKIGEPKYATIDGAINLEKIEGGVNIGIYTTGENYNAKVVLKENDRVIFTEDVDITPANPYFTTEKIECNYENLKVALVNEKGESILEYKVEKKAGKKPIEPRPIAKPPKEIETVEELYLNGRHLEQYKHFAYKPEDYYLEGLRRDEYDIRCNQGMGDLLLKKGEFEKSIIYYDKALKRLYLRNDNPENTDVVYSKAIALRFLNKDKESYDLFQKSAWSYKNKSASYYAIAGFESKKGNVKNAINYLDLCLETNAKNLNAKYLKYLLTNNESILKEINSYDPLFMQDLTGQKAIDFAIELINFGLYNKAIEILNGSEFSPMIGYYLAYVYNLLNDSKNATLYLEKAEKASDLYCFPNRLEDIIVLEQTNLLPMASYYLGCLYYDKERFIDASKKWENTISKLEYAPAYRNLSLAYFDHLNKIDLARKYLEKAFTLMPTSDRIFYELTQLYKNLNLSVEERVKLYEDNLELVNQRDDCTLGYATLLTKQGYLDKAKQVLTSHYFHTYEGGEGYLTQHHAWLQKLIGDTLKQQGKLEEAIKAYEDGLTFPLCYGEEKNYFVNDAPIYFGMYECYVKLNQLDLAKDCLLKANDVKGAPTVHTYYQALALKADGKESEARALLTDLKEIGETRYKNKDINDYFGVGAPAYLPFGYDIGKVNTVKGKTFIAFAELGLGNEEKAKEIAKELEAIDCCDFNLHLLNLLLNKI